MSVTVTIAGAGISGLVLGRCLQQRGIKAILYEKSKPLTATNRNNYGITLQATSYRPLLRILGLEEGAFRRKVAVDGAVGGTGRVVVVGGEDDGAFRANRNRLEGLLAEGLDVRWEREIQGVQASAEGEGMVEVEFSDGTKHQTRMLVGADGVHSQVRKATAPEVGFKILPFAVYNGKRKMGADAFRCDLAPSFRDGNVLQQRVGNVLLQVSINERTEDEVSVSYTYSRPAASDDDPLYRPHRAKSEAREMPEVLFSEIDALKGRLQEPYAAVFDSAAMKQDRMLHWLMRTLRVEQHRVTKAVQDNIVLIGEAAHAEPILGGRGGSEAIEDGMELALMLAEHGKNGLGKFLSNRKAFWDQGIQESEVGIAEMHGTSRSSL
ncbi:FAD NAD(P)-binding domain-containing [Lecanosticta acicola]|uniref:FAD NAD(P)-binding domain-containing n=1 Tax=Lecanosticta acicola TaxID=111012 RepID=A0AAI8Z292_9PEZI|nr:FAD NAD(P)-binding domain-containing [Lecanosticta acicola]